MSRVRSRRDACVVILLLCGLIGVPFARATDDPVCDTYHNHCTGLTDRLSCDNHNDCYFNTYSVCDPICYSHPDRASCEMDTNCFYIGPEQAQGVCHPRNETFSCHQLTSTNCETSDYCRVDTLNHCVSNCDGLTEAACTDPMLEFERYCIYNASATDYPPEGPSCRASDPGLCHAYEALVPCENTGECYFDDTDSTCWSLCDTYGPAECSNTSYCIYNGGDTLTTTLAPGRVCRPRNITFACQHYGISECDASPYCHSDMSDICRSNCNGLSEETCTDFMYESYCIYDVPVGHETTESVIGSCLLTDSNIFSEINRWELSSSNCPSIDTWDVSRITNMDHLFRDRELFNGNISTWNVSSVTSMSRTFERAENFNGDISAWDVSSVTYFGQTFHNARSFNADISSWSTDNAQVMYEMFRGAESFEGNGLANTWNVHSCSSFQEMFTSAWSVQDHTKCEIYESWTAQFRSDHTQWYSLCVSQNQTTDSSPTQPSDGQATTSASVSLSTTANPSISDGQTTATVSASFATTINPSISLTTQMTATTTTEGTQGNRTCMSDPVIESLDPDLSECEGTLSGDECVFRCMEGFTPSNTARCNDGTWERGLRSTNASECVSTMYVGHYNFKFMLADGIAENEYFHTEIEDAFVSTVANISGVVKAAVHSIRVYVDGMLYFASESGHSRRRLSEDDNSGAPPTAERAEVSVDMEFKINFMNEIEGVSATSNIEAATAGDASLFLDLFEENIKSDVTPSWTWDFVWHDSIAWWPSSKANAMSITQGIDLQDAMNTTSGRLDDGCKSCGMLSGYVLNVFTCDSSPVDNTKAIRLMRVDAMTTIGMHPYSGVLSSDDAIDSSIIIGAGVGAGILLLGLLSFILFAYVKHKKMLAKESLVAKNLSKMSKDVKKKQKDIEMLKSGWHIADSQIELVKKLAAGSFGAVWFGRFQDRPVAIKVMSTDFDNGANSMTNVSMTSSKTKSTNSSSVGSTSVAKFEDKEIQFLMRIRNERLNAFLGCGEMKEDGSIFIVLEYADGGSMDRWIWHPPFGGLPWSTRIVFLKDAARGLTYLHDKRGVVHRDIKSPNVLISKSGTGVWRAKIADFGLSAFVGKRKRRRSTRSTESTACTIRGVKVAAHARAGNGNDGNYVGTPAWMARECVRNGTCTSASDIYSFGCVLYETAAQIKPWGGLRRTEIFQNVQMGQLPTVVRPCKSPCDAYGELMHACWADDPSTRPRMQDVMHSLEKIETQLLSTKSDTDKCDSDNVTSKIAAAVCPKVPHENETMDWLDRRSHFDAADVDRDDVLSKDEFVAWYVSQAAMYKTNEANEIPDSVPGSIFESVSTAIFGSEPRGSTAQRLRRARQESITQRREMRRPSHALMVPPSSGLGLSKAELAMFAEGRRSAVSELLSTAHSGNIDLSLDEATKTSASPSKAVRSYEKLKDQAAESRRRAVDLLLEGDDGSPV